jgi:hypothetical protein
VTGFGSQQHSPQAKGISIPLFKYLFLCAISRSSKIPKMSDIRFKLNTGAEIPALGFGTWQSPAGEVEKAVDYALSAGYKHIDCGITPN